VQVYLPIAGASADVLLLLALGAGAGVLSGMFGVGGGFALTPLLILLGLPPPVAVASQANVVLASSVSGALYHLRRGGVDLAMGSLLAAGGLAGCALGVLLFSLLGGLGRLEDALRFSYVALLSTVGALMVVEGMRSLSGGGVRPRRARHGWAHRLPLRVRFRRSRLYASALLPLGVGCGVGALSAFLGVGGGFVLIPLMLLLVGMPAGLVVGTSLFQMTFVAAAASYLQATQNFAVDLVLAAPLVAGAVVGARHGARLGERLPTRTLRLLLGALLLLLAAQLTFSMALPPADPYGLL